MEGLELSKVDTETLLSEVFKSPEIVKKEERKLEHEIYQTNQSIQNLKQKIEIQQLESKNLLEAYDNVDDILKERYWVLQKHTFSSFF
jgi:predicted nucleic acid-binding protein